MLILTLFPDNYNGHQPLDRPLEANVYILKMLILILFPNSYRGHRPWGALGGSWEHRGFFLDPFCGVFDMFF